jgi:hypothetical protein
MTLTSKSIIMLIIIKELLYYTDATVTTISTAKQGGIFSGWGWGLGGNRKAETPAVFGN